MKLLEGSKFPPGIRTIASTKNEKTDGNPISHLSNLEAARFVEIEKGYTSKKPRATLKLIQ